MVVPWVTSAPIPIFFFRDVVCLSLSWCNWEITLTTTGSSFYEQCWFWLLVWLRGVSTFGRGKLDGMWHWRWFYPTFNSGSLHNVPTKLVEKHKRYACGNVAPGHALPSGNGPWIFTTGLSVKFDEAKPLIWVEGDEREDDGPLVENFLEDL